jgi:lipid II:glycine glycyltransferase (peptidoglycan interpeptide bridge formation enzyme)
MGDARAYATFWGHEVELTTDSDAVFARFSSATRRAIRKAQSNGVTVELGSSIECMRRFYELQVQTRKRHGLPPQPWSFFANFARYACQAGQCLIALAVHEGRTVAGAVFCHFGGQALYKFAASDDRQLSLRPNNMVVWEAVKRLCDNGLNVLHLGRTDLPHEGLRHFKQGFGSREHPIEYFRYDLSKRGFVAGTGSARPFPNRVFRLLPKMLLRMVGRVLYRHVA